MTGVVLAVAAVAVVAWRALLDAARTIGADLAESQHERSDGGG